MKFWPQALSTCVTTLSFLVSIMVIKENYTLCDLIPHGLAKLIRNVIIVSKTFYKKK